MGSLDLTFVAEVNMVQVYMYLGKNNYQNRIKEKREVNCVEFHFVSFTAGTESITMLS